MNHLNILMTVPGVLGVTTKNDSSGETVSSPYKVLADCLNDTTFSNLDANIALDINFTEYPNSDSGKEDLLNDLYGVKADLKHSNGSSGSTVAIEDILFEASSSNRDSCTDALENNVGKEPVPQSIEAHGRKQCAQNVETSPGVLPTENKPTAPSSNTVPLEVVNEPSVQNVELIGGNRGITTNRSAGMGNAKNLLVCLDDDVLSNLDEVREGLKRSNIISRSTATTDNISAVSISRKNNKRNKNKQKHTESTKSSPESRLSFNCGRSNAAVGLRSRDKKQVIIPGVINIKEPSERKPSLETSDAAVGLSGRDKKHDASSGITVKQSTGQIQGNPKASMGSIRHDAGTLGPQKSTPLPKPPLVMKQAQSVENTELIGSNHGITTNRVDNQANMLDFLSNDVAIEDFFS